MMKLCTSFALLVTALKSEDSFFYGGEDFDDLNVKATLSSTGAPRIMFGKVDDDDNQVSCVTFVGSYETSNSLSAHCGESSVVSNSEIAFSDFKLTQNGDTSFTFNGNIQGTSGQLQLDFDLTKDSGLASTSSEIYGLHYELSLSDYSFVNPASKFVLRVDADVCATSKKLTKHSKFDSDRQDLTSASGRGRGGRRNGNRRRNNNGGSGSASASASVSVSVSASISTDSPSLDSTDAPSTDSPSTDSPSADVTSAEDILSLGIDSNSKNRFNFGEAIIVNSGSASQVCSNENMDLAVDICYTEKNSELRYIFDNFDGCDIERASSFIGANDLYQENYESSTSKLGLGIASFLLSLLFLISF